MMPPRKVEHPVRPLTATEKLRAQIAPSPAELVRLGLPADAWKVWNEEHGPAFRALHGIGGAADLERVGAEPAPVGALPLPPGL